MGRLELCRMGRVVGEGSAGSGRAASLWVVVPVREDVWSWNGRAGFGTGCVVA